MKTVMTFGRMNPPTRGHEKLVDRVKELAGDGDHHVFVSGSHDPKRNPLNPKQKNSYLKSSFPGTNISQQPSAFHAMKKLHDDGYKDVTVVVGADRVDDFNRIGNHKDFSFDKFNVVSAGEREGGEVENISASRARQAAKDKNYGEFKAMTPTLMSGKQSQQMFSDLQSQMEEFGLTEELFADQEELELFFEAFLPMKYLFEQDTYTAQNMAMDTMQGGADLGQGNEDRDRKRLDREASRRGVESNPWPELLVVRTAQDNKLRIIPKADFDQNSQEIIAGNYPGAPPMGEVTPQISFSVMQEPDFEASKTSNKLLKMFGVNDPRELDIGSMSAGGGGGAPAPVGGAPMSPEEQMAMGMAPPPRTPPDGIEITDPMSTNPDWDHAPQELVAGGVMAWNSATGRNPMDGGVPLETAEFMNISTTLGPASERFGQALLQEIPPDYVAYDNANNPGQLTPEWQQNGGQDPSPTSNMVFMNPATNDFIRANVAVGKENLMSRDPGEATTTFNTMTSLGLTIPFAKQKQVKELTSTVKSKLTQNLSGLQQIGSAIRESKEDIISEATQIYDSVAGKIEDLLSVDKSMKKLILREVLTGELKFGPESTSAATHVIATNKDGTDTQLQRITNSYVTKLLNMIKMNIVLTPANIEERIETEETTGDTFIDYIRAITQNMQDTLDTSNMSPDGYNAMTSFSVDGVPESDLDAKADPFAAMNADNDQQAQNFDSAETKQNLSMMVQQAVGGFKDIFDVMRFFTIGVEAIDIDPINLTLLNDKKADKYNIITVNGKRFRVPVERTAEQIMDDYEYIDAMFQEYMTEGRKVRKYKKGKCGTGSDPEYCYQKKRKKYRAKLQQYNRDKGTHGNGDGKDASHKNGKIAGFEDEGKNRSRNGKGSTKRKKIKEEHGAGDMGTMELLLKYLNDTPYSGIDGYDKLFKLKGKKDNVKKSGHDCK
jgi:hypothetical protein